MTRRRLLAWTAVFVSVGLAGLGFIIFIVGVVTEFFATRYRPVEDVLSPVLSPTIQLALSGLCLSGLMMLLGFTLVGILLARQTRKQAPGYGDAYRFLQRFQFNQAIPVLERAIDGGHETPDLLMMLTSAYAHTGQIGKAQATADRAVQLFPQDASAYISLANGYRLQASYEEAARALQTAAELAPEQPVVWAELGFVQRMAGDDSGAFEAFQQAAQSPLPAMYGVRVYYHLAQAYKQQGDAENAANATAKMMSARQGLTAWHPIQNSMDGTVYGQALRYEIANIEDALKAADAGNLG